MVGLSSELTFEQCKEMLLQAEVKRLELRDRRLSLQTTGGESHAPVVSSGPSHSFDGTSSLHSVPQFCQQDSDTIFSLSE